jgi:hypothetical protein
LLFTARSLRSVAVEVHTCVPSRSTRLVPERDQVGDEIELGLIPFGQTDPLRVGPSPDVRRELDLDSVSGPIPQAGMLGDQVGLEELLRGVGVRPAAE